MKKSTIAVLVSYLDGATLTNLDEIRDELQAELDKGAEKAAANRALYDAAKDAVLAGLTDTPVTIAELFEAVADTLPEGFTRSKMQYAISNYWADEVVKHDGRPATYSRKA